EGKEEDERGNQRQEGGRRDDVDTATKVAHLLQDGDGDRWRAPGEDEADKQVVPDPQELKDGEGGNRGISQWQDDAPEDAGIVGAVHAGALQQLVWNPDKEVAEQEGRVGKRERRVEEEDSHDPRRRDEAVNPGD